MSQDGQTLETTRQRFQAMNTNEQIEQLTGRWEVARDIFELLVEAVKEEKIPGWDVYPTVAHTVTGVVSALFGLAPAGGMQPLELASIDTALAGRLGSGEREFAHSSR